MSRRLQAILALAVVAAALSFAAASSGASFTSASSTSVQASTSGLSSDTMVVDDSNGDPDGQSAVAGTAVAIAPSVLITDGSGNPVAGLTVTFSVTGGGGSVTGPTVTTQDDGIATVGGWTLGAIGANTLRATCAGITGSPITFTATGVAGQATRIAMNAGDAQSAVAGTTVTTAPSVLVTDAGNHPVANVVITFAVASGGGTISGASATTNASGIATVGSWTLGTTVGANSLTATRVGLTGSPVTFTATGVAGAARKIAANGGGGQTVHVGTPVTIPPSVIVTDINNNPVAGVAVTFAVTAGGGTITGGSATTNASGIATVGSWTLGATVGANTLTATSTGLTGSPVTFTATGIVGSPTTIALNAGNGQTATVGTAVATAPSVRVTDALNSPVSGVAVTFAVASGGGSITGASTTTNAFGIATVGSWTMGTTAGANTLTATSPGLTGSPLTVTATGAAGTPTRYVVTSSSYAPAISTPVTITAQLADQYGNAVATPTAVAVTFTKTGAGGTLSPITANTNPSGVATTTFTVANTVGTAYTVTATSTSPTPTKTGTTPTITTVAGAPAKIAANGGSGQSATVGTAVATAPSVLVTDAYNNPVAGFTVTFAVASGGGSVTGASATTNAAGIATVGGWTLGTTAGANTLTVTSAGLTGSPVTFTATGLAGPATKYVVTSSNYGPVAGTAVTITAQLADQYGNPVATSGIRVTFSRTGTGGRFSTTRVNTNASGIATTTFTTSGTAGRTYTFTARSTNGGTRTGTSPTVTTVPGPATQIARYAGNTQTATAGTAVATAPSVRVRDSRGNNVAGVSVTFAVASGGGSVTGASAVTNASGIATVGSWTLGTTAGANTLTATSPGLTGSPVTFTATGVAGPATRYVVTSNNYSPFAGAAVTITAQLADQYGNSVATQWIAVTFTRAPATGTFTGANPATTNAAGAATITFTTGTTVGTAYTVTATSTTPATGTSPTITTR
jgi:adhesin/invasin